MSGTAEQYFFAPGPIEGFYSFDPFESKHIRKVLRKQPGDSIWLTDGKGNLYEAEIVRMDKQTVNVVVRQKRSFPLPEKRLHIYIAPPKLPVRFEWFLEKAVELGVWHITPIITRYTQIVKWKAERFERIIITAMKQSKRVFKPVLDSPQTLDRLFHLNISGYVALCDTPTHYTGEYSRQKSTAVFIGPEGGFSPEEKKQFLHRQIKPISLSDARLRTETAAITAACLFYSSSLIK